MEAFYLRKAEVTAKSASRRQMVALVEDKHDRMLFKVSCMCDLQRFIFDIMCFMFVLFSEWP
jgi:hypothetical protein